MPLPRGRVFRYSPCVQDSIKNGHAAAFGHNVCKRGSPAPVSEHPPANAQSGGRAVGCRCHRAVHARCQSGEVASGAYELVFEAMVLSGHDPDYRAFDPNTRFSSILITKPWARPCATKRGLLTRPRWPNQLLSGSGRSGRGRAPGSGLRPAVRQLWSSAATMSSNIRNCCSRTFCICSRKTVASGLPAGAPRAPAAALNQPLTYSYYSGGVVEIGHSGNGFAFDCEGPRHRAIRPAYKLANRCVTNRECWSSSPTEATARRSCGCRTLGREPAARLAMLFTGGSGWTYFSMTLHGAQPVDLDAPVAHVSYLRPTPSPAGGTTTSHGIGVGSAAQNERCEGNFADSGLLRAVPPARGEQARSSCSAMSGNGPARLFTLSGISPYCRCGRRIQRKIHVGPVCAACGPA